MMPRLDPIVEAERIRERRLVFELAQAAKISLAEARRRMVEARWRLRDSQRARCGTLAPAIQAISPIDDSDEGLEWWQR